MTFFNQKENILELKLTSYGEEMLSKGKFKPVEYSFSDEGVNYRFVTPSEEGQNDIDGRIKLDTPYLRVQKNRFSNSKDGRSTNITGVDLESEIAKRESLGKCDTILTSSSRLKVFAIDNNFESFSNFYTSSNASRPDIPIPQMDVNLEFKTAIADFANPEIPFAPDPALSSQEVFQDGGSVYVSSEQITLLIQEEGVPSSFGDFEVEVFEILDEVGEPLRKLTFEKTIEDFVVNEDNIYRTQESQNELLRLSVNHPATQENVEFYFDVRTDAYREIPESYICSRVSELKRQDFALDASIEALCSRKESEVQVINDNAYINGLPDSDRC